MRVPIFMIFSFVMTIATWAKKALEDGQITAEEAFDLIRQLADHLDVPLALGVSEDLTKTIVTAAAGVEAAGEVIETVVSEEVKPARYMHLESL